MNILTDIAGAQARETRVLVIELCGVFWIAAELVILFFVIEARRHLGRSPVPAKPVWDRVASLRACIFIAFMVAALSAVIARPAIWVPLSARLQRGSLDVNAAALHDFHALLRHLTVWAAFVTVWVVLEGAIVYQGCRAYRVFRNRIPQVPNGLPASPGIRKSAILLLLLGAALAAEILAAPAFAARATALSSAKAADHWSEVVQISENWLCPYRNAVYLYLRVAGGVWISVEWIAASVLWRTWRLVDQILRVKGSLP